MHAKTLSGVVVVMLGLGLASSAAAAVPVDAVPPSIADAAANESGAARAGDMLFASPGTWSVDNADAGFSYQWQRCLSTCVYVTPPSSTWEGASYLVTSDDVGATLKVVVTATPYGQGLSASAVSNPIGPVQAPGFHLDAGSLPSSAFFATGQGGSFNLSVDRDQIDGAGAVAYRVWDPYGAGVPAFRPLIGVAEFPPGQPTTSIFVSLAVNGVPTDPAVLQVELYGPDVVEPSVETVNIRDPGSPLYIRDPANPLALPSTPPAGNPLGGAQFFPDYFHSLPQRTSQVLAASDPTDAAKLALIGKEPNTERFGAWDGAAPGRKVSAYLDQAAGTVPMISTYRIVSGHCGHWSDSPAEQAAYHAWITSLAQGIGLHRAVLFLEMDSLITQGCLSQQGVAVRMAELRDAINVLSVDPHLVTYLDAGAADALPARVAASLLRRAGVAQIQGFFLNSTHFDWTKKEIAYGEKISRLTGGKHFVINTAENGQGPLRPRHPAQEGNEVLCDPPGRGLGPLPTASTGYRNVDAFAWIANPGVSGGRCRPGAPPSGVFWPALALELARHENFRVR